METRLALWRWTLARSLSCSFWCLLCVISASSLFLCLGSFLINEHRRHLLNSICYHANDETSNGDDFSSLETFLKVWDEIKDARLRIKFLFLKIIKWAPNFQTGEREKKKEKHDGVRTNEKGGVCASEIRSESYADVSSRSPSQVTAQSGPWKPSPYNYTPSFLPPATKVLLEHHQILQLGEGEPRGFASLTKPISFSFKYL